jgi:ribonuclease BN (tRNA processing enzyme)
MEHKGPLGLIRSGGRVDHVAPISSSFVEESLQALGLPPKQLNSVFSEPAQRVLEWRHSQESHLTAGIRGGTETVTNSLQSRLFGCVLSAVVAMIAVANGQSTASGTASSLAQTPQAPLDASKPVAIVLGLGSPNLGPDRSGTSIGIVSGGTLYLFDAGAGVERRIWDAQPKLTDLAVHKFGPVFITHLHRDHTLGLAALLQYHGFTLFRDAQGGGSHWGYSAGGGPFTVYGPGAPDAAHPGIREVLDHLVAAFGDPGKLPKENEGPPNDLPKVNGIEIQPGPVYEDANIKVTAFPVTHNIPLAFGFRVQAGNRVFVISGDTRPSQAVVDACNGCDVLFHEVLGLTRPADKSPRPMDNHTTSEELGELAGRAHPQRLVVYHDVNVAQDKALELIQKGFHGPAVFAHELDIY